MIMHYRQSYTITSTLISLYFYCILSYYLLLLINSIEEYEKYNVIAINTKEHIIILRITVQELIIFPSKNGNVKTKKNTDNDKGIPNCINDNYQNIRL